MEVGFHKKIEGLTLGFVQSKLLLEKGVLLFLRFDLYDECKIIIELADQIDFNLFFLLQPRIHEKIKERFFCEVHENVANCISGISFNSLEITSNLSGKEKFTLKFEFVDGFYLNVGKLFNIEGLIVRRNFKTRIHSIIDNPIVLSSYIESEICNYH